MSEQTQENQQKDNEINLLFMALEEIKDLADKFIQINEQLDDNCTQNQKKITVVGNNPNLWGRDEYIVPLKCFVCYKTGGKPVLRLLINNGEFDINGMVNDLQMPMDDKIDKLISELEVVSGACRRKREELDFDQERDKLRQMSDAIILKLKSGTSIDNLVPLESVMEEVKQ